MGRRDRRNRLGRWIQAFQRGLADPERIPVDTPFASLIESDVPIVVQHTRLDSRQAENALMTTIAYPIE